MGQPKKRRREKIQDQLDEIKEMLDALLQKMNVIKEKIDENFSVRTPRYPRSPVVPPPPSTGWMGDSPPPFPRSPPGPGPAPGTASTRTPGPPPDPGKLQVIPGTNNVCPQCGNEWDGVLCFACLQGSAPGKFKDKTKLKKF
jgi:hypothetical protein